MKLGSFATSPVNRIRFEIDYSEWLVSPEILSACEFFSDPEGLTLDSAAVVDGTSAVFFVSGGTDGESYNLITVVATDGGQLRQDYIVVSVSYP